MRKEGFVYAALAGLCAALGSVFGKLALNSAHLPHYLSYVPFLGASSHAYIELIARMTCFVLVFAANAVMWNFFTKAMNYSSSVEAVVVNTSFNFLSTALFAFTLFGETLSLQWMFGASLIMAGVAVMNAAKTDDDDEKKRQ